jgi:putative ABC transport system permease protein
VFTLENMLLGLVSAALALIISQAGSWLICSQVFDIAYRPLVAKCALLIGGTVLLVVAVGLIPSISIMRKKPIVFLREQSQE